MYGHCFEHAAILEWVQLKGTCPLTGKPLRADQIFRAYDVKEGIDEMTRLKKELEEKNKLIA